MKIEMERLAFIKFMMLLNSMAPLFILVAIRGIDKIVSYHTLWVIVALLVLFPLIIIKIRIQLAKKSQDTYMLEIPEANNNKEYLFTFLFTVLLPLYSISITSLSELMAVAFAILFVIFVLWNLNLHFINIFFAVQGYRVYTIQNSESIVLLTTRHSIPVQSKLIAHRLSNTVFIELKNYNYGN